MPIVGIRNGTTGHEGVDRPILWRVIGEESDSGGGDGGITVLSEYVLDSARFFPNTAWIDSNGNIHYWKDSNIRAWLNNGNFTGRSDTGVTITGAAPADYSSNGNGFLNSFSGSETTAIKDTPVITSTYVWDTTAFVSGSTEQTTDKIFLPWGTHRSGSSPDQNKVWYGAYDRVNNAIPSGGIK